MRILPQAGLALAAMAFAATPVLAQDKEELKAAEDREWVTVSGVVTASINESFTLNYGEGMITVEMDDYDAYNDNVFTDGDRVTVTGRIDDDFYETRSIEASSVFSKKHDTFFYANPADEESALFAYPVATFAANNDWVGVTGMVEQVGNGEMIVDLGAYPMTIDTTELPAKPGAEKGDRVSIYGKIDRDVFEGRELVASSVVTLAEG